MNATSGLELRIAAWLERDGPAEVSERVIEAALAEADTIRQRPAWLTSTWWSFRPAGGETAVPPSGSKGRVAGRSLRLGWVVLAVALLLALGGLLAVGALRDRPTPLVSGCAAGSTPDVKGPGGQQAPAEIKAAVWDPTGGALLVFEDDLQEGTAWRFDVCTNRWVGIANAAGAPLREASVWSGVALAHDADSARLVMVERRAVWSFDPQAMLWTRVGRPPFDHGYAPDIAYDPVTGLVVVFDGARMWTLDVDTGAWRELASHPTQPSGQWRSGSLAYDRAADRFILVLFAYGSVLGSTWEFDPRTRTWTRQGGDASDLAVGRLTRSDFLVYDEVNERMLAFGTRGVAAYDRAAGEWQILEEAGSHDWHWAAKAFDPLNGRVVAFPLSGMAPTDVPQQFRWTQVGPPSAFDVRTGTWTALVDTGP